MRFVSHPVKSIQGELIVPGDKSISHRSIILGSIANGTSTVQGFLFGDDCLATLKAFQSMGVSIEKQSEDKLIIKGVGKYGLKKPAHPIDCGNSGTSMRLLTGLLAAQSFDSQLIGDSSLTKRPMARVSEPLKQMGAQVNTTDGKAPLSITGGKVLQGIHYNMPVASAQIKSCILLAGIYAEGETSVTDPGVSRDHTEKMLGSFGYPLNVNENTVTLNGNGECIPHDIKVPGDISSAAFFIVAATITPGSELMIRKVGINPTRTGIIHILQQMGANISLHNQRYFGSEPVADIQVKYAKLTGITIPKSLVPLAIDEFPIIFIAAACAEGKTILHGAEELRTKESDRIGAMVAGLNSLGIQTESHPDGATIFGGKLLGGEVNSLDDHRIAMAFAVAGAVAKSPVVINDCANVSTSFPNFVKTANAVQFALEEVSNENR